MGDANAVALRAFLRERLPAHMMPSRFVPLNALPLTPNGKPDRAALPAPAEEAALPDTLPVAPRDDTERELIALWQSVLRVKRVLPSDNFFDLGGHSLLAVRLFARIEKQTGKRLPLPSLFQAPTLAQMADLLRESTPSPADAAKAELPPAACIIPIRETGTQTPLFCVHHIDGVVMCYRDLAHFLGPDQPVYGIQAPAVEGREAPETHLDAMAARYVREVRQVQPVGPYRLCGLSFGGTVAFEMAQQLQAAGQQVDFLGLLDTYAPVYFRSDAADEKERPLLFRVRDQWDTFRHLKGDERRALRQTKVRSALTRLQKAVSGGRFVEDDLKDYIPEALAQVRQANEDAQRAYFPKKYAGHVTLFRAKERLDQSYRDPELSWGELAAGGLEVRDVLGNHYTIVQRPFVQGLARIMQDCLTTLAYTRRQP